VLAGASCRRAASRGGWSTLAKVFVGFIRGGLGAVNVSASTLFGCLSGSSVRRHRLDRLGDDSEMVQNGYSKVFATKRDDLRLGAGHPRAAVAQLDHLLASPPAAPVSIAALFMAGVFPGCSVGACLIG
jgi:TRAP-type C4-dicarboxylate transport system permease large subunit